MKKTAGTQSPKTSINSFLIRDIKTFNIETTATVRESYGKMEYEVCAENNHYLMCNTFLINSNWLDKCNIAGILVLFIMSTSQVEQDYRMSALTYTVDALILFVVLCIYWTAG